MGPACPTLGPGEAGNLQATGLLPRCPRQVSWLVTPTLGKTIYFRCLSARFTHSLLPPQPLTHYLFQLPFGSSYPLLAPTQPLSHYLCQPFGSSHQLLTATSTPHLISISIACRLGKPTTTVRVGGTKQLLQPKASSRLQCVKEQDSGAQGTKRH